MWTRLGRRRPFILGGAVLASLALVLDAQLSVRLDGGRTALGVGRHHQRLHAAVPRARGGQTAGRTKLQGFAIQSLFIGLGGTVASALPWMMTNWFGVAADTAAGHIPHSVRLSFYIGAAAFFGAVLWTVFSTSEYPPTEAELRRHPRAQI